MDTGSCIHFIPKMCADILWGLRLLKFIPILLALNNILFNHITKYYFLFYFVQFIKSLFKLCFIYFQALPAYSTLVTDAHSVLQTNTCKIKFSNAFPLTCTHLPPVSCPSCLLPFSLLFSSSLPAFVGECLNSLDH